MAVPPRRNYFSYLLIPAGTLFALTACGYGYLAFVAVNAAPADAARSLAHPLFQWLRVHGGEALAAELGLLAALTIAMMATEGSAPSQPPSRSGDSASGPPNAASASPPQRRSSP